MAKVRAKLRVLDLKNEKVHTRWGHVQFDKDGLAELEVEESDLQLLRDTKPFPWLVEAPEPAPPAQDPETDGDVAKKARGSRK